MLNLFFNFTVKIFSNIFSLKLKNKHHSSNLCHPNGWNEVRTIQIKSMKTTSDDGWYTCLVLMKTHEIKSSTVQTTSLENLKYLIMYFKASIINFDCWHQNQKIQMK